jgi:hypothetical protein
MINATRDQRRALARENEKYSENLVLMPYSFTDSCPVGLVNVYRSREFLVQEYQVIHDAVECRLSINRTSLDGKRWAAEISWDDLQSIKNQCGYSCFDAVEIYPQHWNVVNVANMRHLWILKTEIPFKWSKDKIK